VDEKIIGTTMPVLELTLNPGEAIFAESGELSWMTSSIQMQTSTQYGGGGGLGGVFKRAVGGGSLFMTEYSAQGSPGMVAFAAKLPGQIFPLDVRPEPGFQFLGHRHAFVAGTHGVLVSMGLPAEARRRRVRRRRLSAAEDRGQGRVWCELSGEIVTYDLRPGEEIKVHPGHVGLFQDTVQFNITTVKGIKNKIFGGDGIFLAQLIGPGRVWLQSLPLARLAHALGEYTVVQGAEAGVAGGVVGGLLRNIGG
jgi:uncharacterized protein (TIGR00266 family)